jgi:hypothetical protein
MPKKVKTPAKSKNLGQKPENLRTFEHVVNFVKLRKKKTFFLSLPYLVDDWVLGIVEHPWGRRLCNLKYTRGIQSTKILLVKLLMC